jgi:hypothetical protein
LLSFDKFLNAEGKISGKRNLKRTENLEVSRLSEIKQGAKAP